MPDTKSLTRRRQEALRGLDAAGRALALSLALLLGSLFVASPAFSQAQILTQQSDGSDDDSSQVSGLSADLQSLVRAAEAEGATVLVIGGTPEPAAGAGASEPSMQEKLKKAGTLLRARIAAMGVEAPSFPSRLGAAFSEAGPPNWPLIAGGLAILALLIGYLAARVYERWARPYFSYLFNPTPKSRAEKICYLVTSFFIRMIGLAIHLVAATLILLAIDYGTPAAQDLQLRILTVFAIWRTASIFFGSLLASEASSHRMLLIGDEDARQMQRNLSAIFLVGFGLLGLVSMLAELGVGENMSILGFVVGSFVAAALLTLACFVHRREIAEMMTGRKSKPVGGGKMLGATRMLAKLWPVLAAVYFLLAWAVSALRMLLGFPNSSFLVASPFLAILGAVALYGVAVMLLDWLMPPSEREKAQAAAAEAQSEETADEPTASDGSSGDDAVGEHPGRRPTTLTSFRDLAERAIGIVIIGAAATSVFLVWGVDVFSGVGFLSTIWELVFVFFVAYLAYQAVKIAIDRRVAAEGGGAEAAEPGDEGGHGGRSRMATLLPLFRNFLLAVIVTMGIMIGLSQMGVDIAPLFAGAGVVGLAIGFGAQTLIKDIFSGAFFLMDDAFRVGEYIDIGTVKGTVEKISIRSMQLRHQLGTLVTVPFGEIQHLSNFSRDWVIMKLPLRLTYNTDVNKVNKLIKNLGKELLNHELIGDKFLEPLKSQGVWMMEDSAMIIRVKFMTRPGDQFQVRKIAYAEIRALFEREGIQFASREVKVRLDDHDHDRHLSEEDKAKIAAAVRPVLDDADAAAGGGGGPLPDQR